MTGRWQTFARFWAQVAGAGLHVPYQTWVNSGADIIDGPAATLGMSMTSANYITPGYLETLRIPMLSGRVIDERDTLQSAPVAIVSQAFVNKFLRDQEPLGSHVKLRLDGTTRLIVGVVGDVATSDVRQLRPAGRAAGGICSVGAVVQPSRPACPYLVLPAMGGEREPQR